MCDEEDPIEALINKTIAESAGREFWGRDVLFALQMEGHSVMRTKWVREANRKLGQQGRELRTAHSRIEAARQALIRDGYFTADEVGDDLAPRITERLAAADRAVIQKLKALLEALDQAAEPSEGQ